MTGTKTHEQQLRIIEKRENTTNAGEEFDADTHLKRSKQQRRTFQDNEGIRGDPAELSDPDDRDMIHGVNEESGHHKRRTEE